MNSHDEVGHVKILVEFTERAVKDCPDMQEQLDRLKAELAELLKKKKR